MEDNFKQIMTNWTRNSNFKMLKHNSLINQKSFFSLPKKKQFVNTYISSLIHITFKIYFFLITISLEHSPISVINCLKRNNFKRKHFSINRKLKQAILKGLEICMFSWLADHAISSGSTITYTG